MATSNDIQFHYDINNDFFKLFLDNKYMVYSCGVWETANNLEEAQKNKLKRIAHFGRIQNGYNILDIGCGFGGMLEYCNTTLKTTHAMGITLSKAQYDYIINKKIPSVSLELCSWSDLKPATQFDAIVSIGAMEHFASLDDRKNGIQTDVYRHFFQCCFNFSKDHAYLGLQTIVTFKKPDTLQSMRDTHYLLKNVFPGSVLPDINSLQKAMIDLYEPIELRTIGLDYARTLKEWKKRLNSNKQKIISEYGEKLLHHYNCYFDSAIRNFENGYTSLLQMSLKKIV